MTALYRSYGLPLMAALAAALGCISTAHAEYLHKRYGCGIIHSGGRIVGESLQNFQERARFRNACYHCERQGMVLDQTAHSSQYTCSRQVTATTPSPPAANIAVPSGDSALSRLIGLGALALRGVEIYNTIQSARAIETRPVPDEEIEVSSPPSSTATTASSNPVLPSSINPAVATSPPRASTSTDTGLNKSCWDPWRQRNVGYSDNQVLYFDGHGLATRTRRFEDPALDGSGRCWSADEVVTGRAGSCFCFQQRFNQLQAQAVQAENRRQAAQARPAPESTNPFQGPQRNVRLVVLDHSACKPSKEEQEFESLTASGAPIPPDLLVGATIDYNWRVRQGCFRTELN